MAWSVAGPVALGGLCTWRLERHWLRLERLDMPLRGLEPGLDGARLAHISDLHCSPIVREQYLRHCVDLVNSLEVDFVAVTGDMLTGPRQYARRVARVLRELSPRVATIACLGNHDYGLWHPRGLGGMRGLSEYVADQLTFADVFVMANESRIFCRHGAAIQFVGVEDYWSSRYNPPMAFEDVAPGVPVVGLCHNPDGAADLAGRGAQWVLAGHTHGNAVRDTRIHDFVLPANHRHFYAGQYALGGGNHLYVNRGLGYARRVNLNARPEITLFTLRPAV
jgi:predicted MPP superfamily phosphohydrolase